MRSIFASGLVPHLAAAASAFVTASALAQVAPTISSQPAITTYINEGENVVLSVMASGDPTLTYQWRRNNVDVTNTGRFSGATSPTLTITGATQFEAGRYTVVVSNAFGTATSNFAYVAARGPFWNQLQVNTVPPNGASPIAFDLQRDLSVVWTSNCGGDPMAGTWELQGSQWLTIATSGRPATCARGYLAFDPVRDRVVQFGGSGSDDRAYEYDGASWTRSSVPGPAPRFGHRMVGSAEAGGVYLFGGRRISDNTLLGDLYFFNGAAWTLVTPVGPAPAPRQDFAMTYDPRCQKVIVFGGNGASGPLADTWEFDIQTNTWAQFTQPTGAPSARIASTMAYYPQQMTAFMFGGLVGANFVNGSWKYDCTTHLWSLASISNNPPASQGYLTYDDSEGRLLMLQGTQTWELITYSIGCPADFNGNNAVNTQDLFDFINGFFTNSADFNGDGTVTSQDFFDYIAAFFTPC